MRENTYIKIETLYRKYRGYVETKNLLAEGFSNRQISTLVNEGYLQKVCYGHYWLSGKQCKKPFDYKCIEVSLSNPDAVICMNSALYYQGVGTSSLKPLCSPDRQTREVKELKIRHAM